MEGFKDFDAVKFLFFITPGATFAIFRSYMMRGFFPKLSKDDMGALCLGGALFVMLYRLVGTDVLSNGIIDRRATLLWIVLIFVIPAALGGGSGLIEASDWIGRSLRRKGLRLPSPEPNAWETMFRELPAGSILMVRLADEVWVYGRWVAGSASSHMSDARDLYLSEIGSLANGEYSSYDPSRGAYIAAGEIKRIEIVTSPQAVSTE